MRFIILIFILIYSSSTFAGEYDSHPTATEAYAHCMTELGPASASIPANYPGVGAPECLHASDGSQYYYCHFKNFASCSYFDTNLGGSHYYGQGCEPGDWMNPITGECLNQDACLDRNQQHINDPPTLRKMNSNCVAGCDFRPVGPHTCMTFSGEKYCSGVWEYTGNQCGVNDPPAADEPDSEEEKCTPISGQTACMKPNGDVCYTSGRKVTNFCWRPGETGEKGHGDEMQTRKPGDTPAPNTIDRPNGDTANKQDESTTSIERNSGGTTINITTTQTNYYTSSGADATPGNPYQGDTGNDNGGGDEDEEGDGDGQQGTHSGNCSAPPVCSIPGTIECAQLQQTWSNHCNAAENHNGPDPLAPITDQPINAESGLFQDGDSPDTIFQNAPSGGWAGRGACPVDVQFDTPIGNFVMTPDLFCSFLDAFAALVLIIGALHFTMIIGRGIS